MTRNGRYSPEVRERAVRMATEHRGEYGSPERSRRFFLAFPKLSLVFCSAGVTQVLSIRLITFRAMEAGKHPAAFSCPKRSAADAVTKAGIE